MNLILKDPVCGMTVQPGREITAFYQEQKIHFCSEFCRNKFFQHPELYLTTLNTTNYDEAKENRRIAYFSMEMAIGSAMPTYSGGLGVLAGDTLKSFADLRVPAVGVSLLYRKGYFKQKLDEWGGQQEQPVEWSPERFLRLLSETVQVEIEQRTVQVRAWQYDIVGLSNYNVPLILLAHGAKRMARQKVIVKRLASIENFGSMNVLCSDKTGTLTEGVVHIHAALDTTGNENKAVLFYAYLNAFYETGYVNPIDEAIRSHRQFELLGYQKLDEIPYDFIRKRLSILVAKDSNHLLVTKGALNNVLAVCSKAQMTDGAIADINTVQELLQQHYEDFSRQGFRTLGIAFRDIGSASCITKDQETEMTFLGFLLLADPPKPGIIDTIRNLEYTGVSLKIITGDNQRVAANIGQQMGFVNPTMLTGSDLHQISDEALLKRVNEVNVFAEVEPNQKERIILALKKAGNVVGYLGDGINDASALHVADVGISVNSAVDVAKEAADIVLLEKDLDVLVQGVKEGRITFANTLKYVFMATSANFGNMFSMAGASLFLPFLPLLPKQILLTNLLTDFPEMTIATDSVDRDMVSKPRRWDIQFIRNFMLVFGLISSVFDFLTFGTLLFILRATPDEFRTGWFMESVISASLIVLVIRSRKPFFKSQPGKYLLIATLLVVGITLIFPFTPLAKPFGFQPLTLSFVFWLGAIVITYIATADKVKQIFYQRVKF